MGEATFESIPQLITQWCVLNYQAGYPESDHYEGLSPLQCVSIATSTFSIANSLVRFVAVHRRRQFISGRYPAVASLIPIYLFLLSGVSAASTQLRWLRVSGVTAVAIATFSVSNIVSFIVAIFILCLPCIPNDRCRMVRFVLSFITTGGAIGCIVWVKLFHESEFESFIEALDAFHIFRLTLFCCVFHLIIGILVLPSTDVAARIFSPFVRFSVRFVTRIATFCCPAKWRSDVNKIADEILYVEVQEMASHDIMLPMEAVDIG